MFTVHLMLLHLLAIELGGAEFIYGNLFDYSHNLTAVYNDPGHVFGEDLMRTAVFYLDELMELEEALQDKDEEEDAIKMLSDLYHSGGPNHIKKIPYGQLIDIYNWTSKEVDDYASYISKTTQTWNRLLQMLQNYVKSGKISKKMHDIGNNQNILI